MGVVDAEVKNVILTGFMGTGKTTIGRLLAARLGCGFVDTDSVIESRVGSIADIFATDGEERFRQLETEVARELAASTGLVVATGGRLMLDAVNAALLSATGRVFCLAASSSEIVHRLGEDATERPLLRGADPWQRIEELFAERRAGYRRFEQVDTDGRTPEEVVADLVARLALRAEN